jgi:hypothetical protein
MKTQNGFLSENWNFKRALRVSIKIALVYVILNIIWILIFGVKLEIAFDVKLMPEITKSIILPWNSWLNIIPNFIGIVLFGISFFGVLNFFNYQVNTNRIDEGDLVSGLIFGLGAGLIFGLCAGLGVGLGVGLIFGLVFGLIWLIKLFFSKKFWEIIGKWIILSWKFLIK